MNKFKESRCSTNARLLFDKTFKYTKKADPTIRQVKNRINKGYVTRNDLS